jgi:stress response protein SCP2
VEGVRKGARIRLAPEDNKLLIGFGWDRVANIECDACAVLLGRNGKAFQTEDLICFGNLKHDSNSIQHLGDNLISLDGKDIEQILASLTAIPAQYERIAFLLTIYQARQKKQHFGLVRNVFIRILNGETGKEVLRYDLSEDYRNMSSLVCGELYRKDSEWRFNAVGQPTQDSGLPALFARYK